MEVATPQDVALSMRQTEYPETFNDNDGDDRFELLRSGFEIVKEFVEVPRDFSNLSIGRRSRHSNCKCSQFQQLTECTLHKK